MCAANVGGVFILKLAAEPRYNNNFDNNNNNNNTKAQNTLS
jgi:hypothetical protein